MYELISHLETSCMRTWRGVNLRQPRRGWPLGSLLPRSKWGTFFWKILEHFQNLTGKMAIFYYFPKWLRPPFSNRGRKKMQNALINGDFGCEIVIICHFSCFWLFNGFNVFFEFHPKRGSKFTKSDRNYAIRCEMPWWSTQDSCFCRLAGRRKAWRNHEENVQNHPQNHSKNVQKHEKNDQF